MWRAIVRWDTVAMVLILAVGAGLRFYGLAWDGGQWLHPDERQIYFVALGLSWPRDVAEALSPASPLSPHFFAYGSLPIYMVRLAALALAPLWPAVRDPNNLHLAGRPLAALFDLGTVYLTYRLGCRLWPRGEATAPRPDGRTIGVLAAALVSLAVLPIQAAHFYTVDPPLAFFVVLALILADAAARCPTLARSAGLGAAIGLALATKLSAAPLLLVAVVTLYQARPARSSGNSALISFYASRLLCIAAAAGLAFAATQPYAVIDWRAYMADAMHEAQIAWGALDVPYTRQYAGTLPFVYSAWQLALWGLGLPAGLAAWAGLAAALVRWLRRGEWADTLLLAWAGPAFAIAGLLHTRYARYLLPLVPVLCLLAARLLMGRALTAKDAEDTKNGPVATGVHRVGVGAVVGLSLVYALCFETLYAAPHSWITASEWIYRQVPAGSTLAVEAWDTALPLPLTVDGRTRRIEEYDVRTLPLYDEPDDEHKWATLAAELAEADYVIVASRRVYGSAGQLPERYPLAARYYKLLFQGELGLELAGEFTRDPGRLNPRLAPLSGAVPGWLVPDESLVVYDHPRALVFRNASRLVAEDILGRLVR